MERETVVVLKYLIQMHSEVYTTTSKEYLNGVHQATSQSEIDLKYFFHFLIWDNFELITLIA